MDDPIVPKTAWLNLTQDDRRVRAKNSHHPARTAPFRNCLADARGGLNPIVRSARKMQDKIASFGPEALVDDLLPHFVYAAERWQQMTDPDVPRSRPYLRYVCACLPDSRTGHLEKHGLVFPVDHHFWNVWYPPNGLGCMCTVMSVSEDLLIRRGWGVSENRRFEFKTPDEGFDFNIGKVVS